MIHKYEIILYWSEEDGAYIAEVPELYGCMAGGPTAREALSNVEQIIREWIETAQELGRSIPKPKGRLRYSPNENGELFTPQRLERAEKGPAPRNHKTVYEAAQTAGGQSRRRNSNA